MKWYIKERHNPQFEKRYYVKEGQKTKSAANKMRSSLYGHNYILEYETEKEYEEAAASFASAGFTVHQQ